MLNTAGVQENPCPVCQGNQFESFKLGLLRCTCCGLVVSPKVWEDGVNEQMEDAFFGESYEGRKSSWWVDWFEERNNKRTLSRLHSVLPPPARLLEVGVGSGSFLVSARTNSYEVMGIDLSKPICKHVEKMHGIPMFCGELDDMNESDGFDVVVMNHVLEHVQAPVEFMRGVHRVLKPGGIVHLAVPNIDAWEARLSGWTSYEPYHLTYFTHKTLGIVAEQAGFSVLQRVTHESFSGWFLAALRTLLGVNRNGAVEHDGSISAGSGTRKPLVEHAYRMAMVGAGAVTWPLRKLQARLGYGDEVVCLARKDA